MSGSDFDQICMIFSDLFSVDPAGLTLDSSQETIERWDSMQHLNLILDLERHFGVRLSPEEIERMKSIQEIIDVIGRKEPRKQ